MTKTVSEFLTEQGEWGNFLWLRRCGLTEASYAALLFMLARQRTFLLDKYSWDNCDLPLENSILEHFQWAAKELLRVMAGEKGWHDGFAKHIALELLEWEKYDKDKKTALAAAPPHLSYEDLIYWYGHLIMWHFPHYSNYIVVDGSDLQPSIDLPLAYMHISCGFLEDTENECPKELPEFRYGRELFHDGPGVWWMFPKHQMRKVGEYWFTIESIEKYQLRLKGF